MTSCLHFYTLVPSEKGSALNEKNLLPMGANSLLLEKIPFQMGAKTIDSFAFLEILLIPLQIRVP